MNRMPSLLLAVVLLFTFSLPVSAAMVEPVQDVASVTGGSSAPEPEPETSEPTEETSSPEDSPESEDDPPPDMEDADPTEEKSPAEEEQDATEPTVPAAALSAAVAPANTDTFVVDCTLE